MNRTTIALFLTLMLAAGCLDGECMDDDCLQRSNHEVSQGFVLNNATDDALTWVFHGPAAEWTFVTPARMVTQVFLTCREGDVITFETVPPHAFPTGRASCGRGTVVLRAEVSQ